MRGQLRQPTPTPPASTSPYQVQNTNGGQPMPNLNGFFSEAPTGTNPAMGVELTPLQEQVREAMGMDRDTYTAWMVGAQSRRPNNG